MRYLHCSIIAIVTSCTLSGCATQYYNVATGQTETYFVSDEKEASLGKNISVRIEKKVPMIRDDALLDRVNGIGQKLVAVSDRQGLVYHFGIIDEEKLNAVSLPGGYIYINDSVLEAVENDDELAGVLAHEIGHVCARHSVKRAQSSLGYTLFRVLIANTPHTNTRRDARKIDYAIGQLFMEYSRGDEVLADQLSVKYMKAAGYDPAAMLSFLEKLRAEKQKEPIKKYSSFKTHPYLSDRIRTIKEAIYGQADFTDYMNKSL